MRAISHLHSIMRGSVAGITYTANQWHAIVGRARVAPINPNTTYQSAIRSALAGAQGDWLNQSDAVRSAWDDYAATCDYQGPLGNYKVPGRWMFTANIALARYLMLRDITTVTLADWGAPTIPGFLAVADIAPVDYAGPGTGVSIGFTSMNAEDVTFVFERSIGYNPTRYRFKGPFVSDSLAAVEIVGPGGSGFYEFNDLTEGLAYFIRVRAITSDSPHRISSEYIVRAIAVTVV